jgi:hypothetical protein
MQCLVRLRLSSSGRPLSRDERSAYRLQELETQARKAGMSRPGGGR